MINQLVNNIAHRLSLRQPQRQSLEILDRVCQILPINGQSNIETSLVNINKRECLYHKCKELFRL
jgi:type III restriction enzyme